MRLFSALLMGEGQLPDEFTRVNWIQSNSNQFLNLGVIGTTGHHRMAVDMLLPSASNSSTTVFGSRIDSGGTRRSGNMYFPSALTQGVWIGTSTNVLSQAHVQNQRFQYSIDVNQTTQTVTTDYNGLVRSASFSGSTNSGVPFYLFGCHVNGNAIERGTFRIYGFRLWLDGVLARDLVPVIDRYNEAQMFCNITQEALTNQGTSAFIYG